jgi:hypothetical protein
MESLHRLAMSENQTSSPYDDDILLLLDPDMILLRPIVHDFTGSVDEPLLWVEGDALPNERKVVRHGHPIAQQDPFLGNEWMYGAPDRIGIASFERLTPTLFFVSAWRNQELANAEFHQTVSGRRAPTLELGAALPGDCEGHVPDRCAVDGACAESSPDSRPPIRRYQRLRGSRVAFSQKSAAL